MRIAIKFEYVVSVVFAALLLLASCSRRNDFSPLAKWMKEDGKIKVLSTIAQIGDLATEIGGDRVDGWVLVSGDLDPHTYELVKGDGEKLDRADLIFYNGLGLEHGASLSSRLCSSPKAAAVGEAIRSGRPQSVLEKGGVVDPHCWMDVSLWKHAGEEILRHLIRIDPEGRPYYAERAALLNRKMEELHASVRDQLQKVPSSKRFLVTSHDAFRYFARAYLADPGEKDWSSRFTAPEGLSPDGQLNPIDIQRTIDFLKSRSISVVFPESNVSRDAVMKIAAAGRELGLHVRLCGQPLYGDSTSGHSYFEMMRLNAEVISENLERGE